MRRWNSEREVDRAVASDDLVLDSVKDMVRGIADEHDIGIDELIVFGSRTRDDYREQSDIDIVVVSPDFAEVNWYRRPKPFLLGWDYDELPVPEILCYTPAEFAEKKERKPHIVRTAVEDGVSLA